MLISSYIVCKTVTKKTKSYNKIEDPLRVCTAQSVVDSNAQLKYNSKKILKTSYRKQENQYFKFVLEKPIFKNKHFQY